MFRLEETTLHSVVEASIINHVLSGQYDCYFPQHRGLHHPTSVENVKYYKGPNVVSFTVVKADGTRVLTALPSYEVTLLKNEGWLQ